MGLSRRERRELRKLGNNIRKTDPLLASMLDEAGATGDAGGMGRNDVRRQTERRGPPSPWGSQSSYTPFTMF
jgi:hypothetical protein